MKNTKRTMAIQMLDNYLTFIASADFPLDRFDKSLLATSDFCDLGVAKDIPIFEAATASDLEFAWTVRFVWNPWDDGTAEFSLNESKTVSRGLVARFVPEMPNRDPGFFDCFSRYTTSTLHSSGRLNTHECYIGHRGRKATIFDPAAVATENGVDTCKGNHHIEEHVKMSISIGFIMPSFWMAHVAITDNAPRVTVPTDPTGVKELWKFRDIPEGARRRDALLHWVSEHWRKDRFDPDVELFVRSSLRGARSLTCSGLSIAIEESTDDRKKLVESIRDRRLKKIHKRDRRRTGK